VERFTLVNAIRCDLGIEAVRKLDQTISKRHAPMEEPGARVIRDKSYRHIIELSTGTHHITDGRIGIIVLIGASSADNVEIVLQKILVT
jgi:hypothetical protein